MRTRRNTRANRRSPRESGAVAVEFALVLPIFLVLVLGIAEFSRAFNIQVSLSEAGREASRYAAIHCSESTYSVAAAQSAGIAAAPSVALGASNISITYSGTGSCDPANNAIARVSYTTPWMTGFPALIPGMPASLSIAGTGVMRCGG
jgi:Flp pilus assembly protein TadG